MANPFPGMDPYLEGDLWPTVHFNLAAEIARMLAPKVRPKYFVFANQQFIAAEVDADETRGEADRIPDVGLSSRHVPATASEGVAIAPLVRDALISDAEQQVTVEIHDAAERRLVTAIEVLSPANKRGPGLRQYRAKRDQYLRSPAHLIEIDLLRVGRRFPVTQPLTDEPYFIFLSRVERRPKTDIWPVAINEPLPEISIPLLAGDIDVKLDLQAALNSIHDLYGYADALDYSHPPPGALTDEQALFVEQTLRRRQ